MAETQADRHGRLHRLRSRALTALAFVVVWLAMVAPVELEHVGWGALVRLPVEMLLVAAVGFVPWRSLRITLAVLLGLLVALVLLAKILELGFEAVFDRPFDPVGDWAYLGPGVGVLGDSIGSSWAQVVAVAAGVAALALLVGVPLAVLRLARLTARSPRLSLPAATALGVAWVLCFAVGVRAVDGAPVASRSAAALAADEVQLVRSGLADHRRFAREIQTDPYADVRDDELFAGLRGKDVLVVFVESYGRVAIEGSSFAPGVLRVLESGERRLRAAG